ncbi:MAG: methyltransferase domain-containing protein [Bauldia sp.]|nr:methyltransferase domain-containing protein [Bauldia sp.]
MAEPATTGAVLAFYDTHPINERQILEKLRQDGHDPAHVTEDVLKHYDQDHFGGVAANDTLVRLAGIDADSRVLDVCCGMGGPSRYLAHTCGCRVTGIDMNAGRIEGARTLTAMAGLDGRVGFEIGNALAMPFADGSFDVLISQEAFCHVPDKRRLVGECARVLKAGGRIAFTDILATARTDDATRARLGKEMTFQELGSLESYSRALDEAGCAVESVEDLGEDWRVILVDRLAMYRRLKDQTVERFGLAHYEKWDRAYSFFVGLYQTGELGGGRFLARRRS